MADDGKGIGDVPRAAVLGDIAHRMWETGGYEGSLASRVASMLEKHGIKTPSVHVQFSALSVETDAMTGSAAIPSLTRVTADVLKTVAGQGKRAMTVLPILKDLRGSLEPGRMTLLLGPPASGKTTLLKHLAGIESECTALRSKGTITYNGKSADSFVVERAAVYVDQHDAHLEKTTVQETLDFAHRCQMGREPAFNIAHEIKTALASKSEAARPSNDGIGSYQATDAAGDTAPEKSSRRWVRGESTFLPETDQELLAFMAEAMAEGALAHLIARLLGIARVGATMVGSQQMRGISGGERKRLTTAEMVVGPRNLMLMDEISTGLDSATLFTMISHFRHLCHVLKRTMVIALLQPPPETFQLFDDVMLLAEGRIVYHGPIGDSLGFMADLGFICPTRKDVPSFLQEVCSAPGQWLYASEQLKQSKTAHTGPAAAGGAEGSPLLGQGKQMLIPMKDMAEAFYTKNKHGIEQSRAATGAAPDPSGWHKAAITTSSFALAAGDQLALVLKRQWSLVMRDKSIFKARLGQVVVIGAIMGSCFFDLQPTPQDGRTFFGASFMSLMFLMLGNIPQLAIVMKMHGVWLKHRRNRFFSATTYTFSLAISQGFVTLIEGMLFSIVVYFMVGFTRTAACFFTFYFVAISLMFAASSVFRLIAVSTPNPTVGMTVAATGLLFVVAFSGFVIVRKSIPDPWIWLYWMNPMAYAFRALVVNEMTSGEWSYPVFGELCPVYPGTDDAIPACRRAGHVILESFDFHTEKYWVWVGVAYLWSLTIVLNVLVAVNLWRRPPPQDRAVIPDEEALKKQAAEAAARKAALAASADLEAGAQGKGALPFAPITLCFLDMNYWVPNPAWKKSAPATVPRRLHLLKNITGYVEPGTMTCLMGGSGAGKTTLLDVLAGRKTVGETSGTILVNGHPKEQRTWARVVGYCEQNDIHSPCDTVREALMLSARLRLDSSVPMEKVASFVDEIMEVVDLATISQNIVGIPGESGLSTEQRKRLTIAVELVANPSVVFMDEPTSGLDAKAAATVMTAVRNVASNGRTVIVTIHQPSMDIFESFDRLILLQLGGQLTYFGPLGTNSSDLVAYLRAVPGVPALPDGHNPATWMLEVTGGSAGMLVQAADADFPDVYANSELYKRGRQEADRLAADAKAANPKPLQQASAYAATYAIQQRVLLGKFARMYWRTPAYNLVRMVMTVVVSFVMGTLYAGEGRVDNPATISNVQNVVGIVFVANTFVGMVNLLNVQPVLSYERSVFYREKAARYFSTMPYALAIALVELPYLLVQCVIFCCFAYFVIDFARTASAFFLYAIIFFQTIAVYTYFGQFLVFVTPNSQVAQIVAGAINFLLQLFNGFAITYDALPIYWKWFNRLVPTTWSIYGLAVSQLGDPNGQGAVMMKAPGGEIMRVDKFIKDQFGYDYNMRWVCAAILCAYMAFFCLGGMAAQKFVSFQRR